MSTLRYLKLQHLKFNTLYVAHTANTLCKCKEKEIERQKLRNSYLTSLKQIFFANIM